MIHFIWSGWLAVGGALFPALFIARGCLCREWFSCHKYNNSQAHKETKQSKNYMGRVVICCASVLV